MFACLVCVGWCYFSYVGVGQYLVLGLELELELLVRLVVAL